MNRRESQNRANTQTESDQVLHVMAAAVTPRVATPRCPNVAGDVIALMTIVTALSMCLHTVVAEANSKSDLESHVGGDSKRSAVLASISSSHHRSAADQDPSIASQSSDWTWDYQSDQPAASARHATTGRGRSSVDDDNHVGGNDLDEADYDLGQCGSDNCTSREIKRRYRYASIRSDILKKLRLTGTPNMNITGRHLPAIPDLHSTISYMCRQNGVSCSNMTSDQKNDGTQRYQTQNDEQETVDDYHATTVKVLLFPVHGGGRRNESNVVRFNLQQDSINGDIVNATLGVFLRRPSVPEYTGRSTWLLAYRRHGVDGTERNLIHKRRIHLTGGAGVGGGDGDTNDWHQIRLTRSNCQWLRDPIENHGIEIQVADGRGYPLAIIEPRNENEQPLRPYLEVHVRSGRQNQTPRMKRQIGDLDCDDLSLERRCCRYPLVVDFDAFGWDWVIVPRRYSAYYCSGECPFLYYQTQGHQHVRQQAGLAGSTGGPCCSPKKVSAISMLYYDESMNIIHGKLPSMVVEQCGCS